MVASPERLRASPGRPAPKSQTPDVISYREHNQGQLDLQARKIHRLFFFCYATACTLATLAYGVAR
jgi:hypothetical protein